MSELPNPKSDFGGIEHLWIFRTESGDPLVAQFGADGQPHALLFPDETTAYECATEYRQTGRAIAVNTLDGALLAQRVYEAGVPFMVANNGQIAIVREASNG